MTPKFVDIEVQTSSSTSEIRRKLKLDDLNAAIQEASAGLMEPPVVPSHIMNNAELTHEITTLKKRINQLENYLEQYNGDTARHIRRLE